MKWSRAIPGCGFTQMEDWYRVTRRHFKRHRGGGLLGRKFHDSPSALLKDVFPYYDWKEWLFVHVPRCFWQQRANRRRYFDWLGQQLGYRRPEDWYRLTQDQLIAHGGARPLKPFGDSLLPLLKDYLPEYEWLEWRFRQVPKGFWDKRANRLRYLNWLGQQLGFQRPEDWYQLSTQQLRRWYGRSLLKKFRDPRVAILKEYLPKGDWQEWLFKKSPNGFWRQRANRRRYLDWLGQQLGFRRSADWARLRASDVLRYRGKGMLKQFQFRIAPLVREYLAYRNVPTTDRRRA